ncbi:MAG: helix-turn-helix transcriptional regulator [Nitriliruptoraceae bacterium]|nr:helix-turn-helix transcriptional regulator [Nitriliruptoraceae bacterium]
MDRTRTVVRPGGGRPQIGWQSSVGVDAGPPMVGRTRLLRTLARQVDGGGVLALRGEAGIGKSRLLQALGSGVDTAVERLDLSTDRPASASLDALDPAALRPEGDTALVLLIDDLPRLPAVVERPLARLSAERWCQLIVAGRPDDADEAWWHRPGWRSVEVPPLDRIATAQLVQELLGAPAHPRTCAEIFAATGGNPTAVVAVVAEAQMLGALIEDQDAWSLVGPLPIGALGRLVGPRLDELGPEQRAASELIALAGAVPIRMAVKLVDPRVVRELDARGVIRLVGEADDASIRMADPMIGEVVRAGIDAESRRRHLAQLLRADVRAGGAMVARREVSVWAEELGWGAPVADRAPEGAAAGDPWSTLQRPIARELVAEGLDAGTVDRGAQAATAAASRLAPIDTDGLPVEALRTVVEDDSCQLPLSADRWLATAVLADPGLAPRRGLARTRGALEAAMAHSEPATAWWCLVHARLALRSGALGLADERALTAWLSVDDEDPLGLAPSIAAVRAIVAASTGRFVRAEVLLEAAPTPVTDEDRHLRALADAWVEAGIGGMSAGAAKAHERATAALALGRRAEALEAWELAVRFGDGAGVADAMTSSSAADEMTTEPRWTELLSWAVALRDGDATALRRAAEQAASTGRALLAAERAAQAAELGGAPRDAALASGLAAVCPDADTPALERVARTVLTPRRQQAAQLAIQGRSTATIAARLGVSTRTVENHLAAVYRTLGVRGRRELERFYRADAGLLVGSTDR